MEIERKYLVGEIPLNLAEYPVKHMEQMYVSVSPVIRIRRSNDRRILTVKSGGLLARQEFEMELSEEEYVNLVAKAEGNAIKKDRYIIPLTDTDATCGDDGIDEKLVVELDVFAGAFDGLVYAEVEFPSVEFAEAFVPPAWFTCDVTGEAVYQNSSLSSMKPADIGSFIEEKYRYRLQNKEYPKGHNLWQRFARQKQGGYNAMKTRVLFAQGYEEVEALTVVDIIRRAGIECSMVAADDTDTVTSSHGVEIVMDEKLSDIKDECDAVILPGGMPGVTNLAANPKVQAMVKAQYDRGAWVAAICAAPTALGKFGILKGRKATCYPGMEAGLTGADACTEPVVIDGNVVTSRGVGTAIEFGLTLVSLLIDEKSADDLAAKIVYTR